MAGVNKVIIVGNLGNDPEVKYTPSGSAIATISIATSEQWKDKQTGEQREKTEWHRVVMFNRLGEIAGEYLRKGSQVYIEGRLRTNKWQDQSGNDRYTTEIVANTMQMLGARSATGGTASFDQSSPSNNNYQQGGQKQVPKQQSAPPASAEPMADFDDDIPF